MTIIHWTIGAVLLAGFQERVRAPGPAYGVSIASWDKCAGGGQ